MSKTRVLFVCIHNSARSQIAEELLRKYGGEYFEVESAGIKPGTLNPYVVMVLKEEGIDITGKKTQSAFEYQRNGKQYDYVITVCDETSAEQCPVFPGKHERIHWGFPDPSKFKGSDEEIIERVTEIKELIKQKIIGFVENSVG